jgi:hypothetical protein
MRISLANFQQSTCQPVSGQSKVTFLDALKTADDVIGPRRLTPINLQWT